MAAGPTKDVKEFQFKVSGQLRVISSNEKLNIESPVKLVTTSSKYGLVFVGTPSGITSIISSSILNNAEIQSKPLQITSEFPRRNFPLPSQPSHVDVSADNEFLAVAIYIQNIPVLHIYSVASFASMNIVKKNEMRMSNTAGVKVIDMQWNPGVPNMIGAVMSDGSVIVFEIKDSSFTLNSVPSITQAKCLCWSPKGKQVVIGSADGSLTQYKPDLKPVKTFAPPFQSASIVSVFWPSSFQFIAAYFNTSTPNDRPAIVVVNVPKGAPTSYAKYEDICFGTLAKRPEYHFIHQQTWNLLIIGCGDSMELSILGLEGNTSNWVHWKQDDSTRAELPLTDDKDDTHNLGISLDTSPTQPIQLNDSLSVGPMPIVTSLSHDGVLCFFTALNLMQGVPSVCSPSQPFPDSSGLSLFTTVLSKPQASVQPTQTAGVPNSTTQSITQPVPAFSQPSSLFGAVSSSPNPIAGNLFSQAASNFDKPVFGQSALGTLPSSTQPSTLFSGSSPFSQATTGFPKTTSIFQSLTPSVSQTTTASQPLPQAPATTQVSSQLFSIKPLPAVTSSQSSAAVKPLVTLSTSTPGFGSSTQTSSLFSSGVPKVSSAAPSSQPALSFGGFGLDSMQNANKDAGKTEIKAVEEPKQVSPILSQITTVEPPEEKSDSGELDKAAYTAAIHDELSSFAEEFSGIKHYLGSLKVKVGEENMKGEIRCKMDTFETFNNELVETTQAQCFEISSLKASLLDMVSMIQLIKTKQQISKNPSLIEMREAEDMDLIGKHWCKRIEQRLYSLQSQIKVAVEQMESIKNSARGGGLKIPTFEAVLQTMINLNKIAYVQRNFLNNIEDKLNEKVNRYHQRKKKIIQRHHSGRDKFLDSDSHLSTLAQKLLQTKLESSIEDMPCSYKESSTMMIAKAAKSRGKIDSNKETSLKNWLKSHKTLYSKVAPLQSNKSSNFDSPLKPLSKSIEMKKSPVGFSSKEPESLQVKPHLTTPIKSESKPINRNLFASTTEDRTTVSGISTLNQEVKGLFMGSVTSTPLPAVAKKETHKPISLTPQQTFPNPVSSAASASAPLFSSKPSTLSFGSLNDSLPQVSLNLTKPNVASVVKASETQSKLLSESTALTSVGSQKSSMFGFGNVSSKENPGVDPQKVFQIPKQAIKPTTTLLAGSGQPTNINSANTLSFNFGTMASTLKNSTISSVVNTSVPPKVEVSSPSILPFSFGGVSEALTSTVSSTNTTISSSNPLFSFSQTTLTVAPSVTTVSSAVSPISSFSFGSVANSLSEPSSLPSTIVKPTTASSILSQSSLSNAIVPSLPSVTSSPVTISSPPVMEASANPVTAGSPVSSCQSIPPLTTIPSKPSVTSTLSTSSITSPTVATTESSAFGVVVSSTPTSLPIASTTTSSSSIFNQVSFSSTKPPISTSVPAFGGPAFGSITTATTSAPPVFGAGTLKFTTPTTSSQSIFGQVDTTTAPAPTSIFNQSVTTATNTTSPFGQPTTTTQAPSTPFSQSVTTPQTPSSPFGQPVTTTQAPTSPFGQPSLAQSTASSPFSQPTTTTASPFGASTFGSAPVFSSLGTSTFGGGSTFGAASTTPSLFGAPATATTTSSLFNTPLFGQAAAQTTTSPFGSVSPQASPFGATTPTSQPPAFGSTASPANPFFGQTQPASVFGQSPSSGNFGSSGGSLFGGNATFGSTPGGQFQSPGGSIFGGGSSGGPFSSGSQSVGQSGFGAAPSFQSSKPASGFGSVPVFGSSSSFGGAPTFGSNASFGSPNKTFGSTSPVSSPGGFGAQGNVFENLANQNTMSFGNLAQGQPQGMTSSFGSPQPQQQQNNPTFGGNAFSSWR